MIPQTSKALYVLGFVMVVIAANILGYGRDYGPTYLSNIQKQIKEAVEMKQEENAIDENMTNHYSINNKGFIYIDTTNTTTRTENDDDDSSSNSSARSNSCRRICPYPRKNRIYLYMGTAGLSDRLAVLQMIAKFAGYLCAVVDLPPPAASLIDIHNHGQQLNKHLKWEDFCNFTFLQDGSPVFSEGAQNPNRSKYHTEWADKGFYNRSKYPPGWRLLISNRSDNLLEHYKIIQEWSWQFEDDDDPDRGFLWEIHQSMYSSKLRRAKPLPALSNSTALALTHQKYNDAMRPSRACVYVDGSNDQIEPTQLRIFRQELQHRVRIRAPNHTDTFGFVHIRRGDAKKSCNSDLATLQDFLQCSLNGTRSTGKRITLLLGSDEHDLAYRQSVLDLVNRDRQLYPHVSMLDADYIVQEMMAELGGSTKKVMPKRLLNNYYQFELLKGIGMDKNLGFSQLFLAKRRSDCKPCVHLLSKYPNAFQ